MRRKWKLSLDALAEIPGSRRERETDGYTDGVEGSSQLLSTFPDFSDEGESDDNRRTSLQRIGADRELISSAGG